VVFRARQLLAPRYGTVWEAKVTWVIIGSDRAKPPDRQAGTSEPIIGATERSFDSRSPRAI